MAIRFECLENLLTLLRQERTCQLSSITSFPHTNLCHLHIFEPNRSSFAILSCWFDSFILELLHGMTFNHWEPNPYWNALIFFTAVGSSRKIKSAISLSKNGPVHFFGLNFQEPFQFFHVRATVQAHHHWFHPNAPNQRFRLRHFSFLPLRLRKRVKLVDERKKRPRHLWLPGELLVTTGCHPFSH